jgi:tetratricopeptide (TPR) repeat protein
MKNQITILFAGGLLAATAVMAAPATAQSGTTFVDRSSNYIAILQGKGSAKGIAPQDAKAYNNRGFAKSKLGDQKGAITDFDTAIKIDPQYAEAYFYRGGHKFNQGI